MTNDSMWIERINAKAIERLKALVDTGKEIALQLVGCDEKFGYVLHVDEDGNIEFAEMAIGGESDGKIVRRISTNYLRVVYFGYAVVEDRPESWVRTA